MPGLELEKIKAPAAVSLSDGGISRNGASALFFETFGHVPKTGDLGTLKVSEFEATERPAEFPARTVKV
jgi:hypothetical protein